MCIGFSEDSLLAGLTRAWDNLSDRAKKKFVAKLPMTLSLSEERKKYEPAIRFLKKIGYHIGKQETDDLIEFLQEK